MIKTIWVEDYVQAWIVWLIKKVLFSFSVYDNLSQESSQLTDVEVVHKIRSWENDKYEILVNRYSQKMFRYVYNYFSFSQDIAEDVIQDIFVKVWQKLDKYDENYSFNSWIYRIAHNYCIDYIKQQKNTYQLDGNEKTWESIKEDVQKDFKRQLTKNILEKLEWNYKEVLILYYFEEKSYDEISYILDTTKNTVWTLVHRAKNKLKEVVNSDDALKDSLVVDL